MKKAFLLLIAISFTISFAQNFKIEKKEAYPYNGTGDGARTVWFSKDNSQVFADFNTITSWDVKSGKLVSNNKMEGAYGHTSAVNDNRTMWAQGASGYSNPEKRDITDMYNAIQIGSPGTKDIYIYRLEEFAIWNIEFINNTNKIVAIISNSKTHINAAVVFDLETRSIDKTFVNAASNNDVMSSITVSDDSKYLAIGYAGKNKRFEIYDFKTSKILKSFHTTYEVVGLEIKKGVLATGGGNTVDLVSLKELNIIKSFTTKASVFHLAMSPNGKSIAVGSFSSGADMLDVESGMVNHFSDGLTNSLAFSPNGNMLAIGMYVTFHVPEVTALEIWTNENPNKVIQKELIKEDVVKEDVPVASESYTYLSAKPNFSIEFPSKPEVVSKQDKNNRLSMVLKSFTQTEAYILNINELSRKTKEKKYYKTALAVADKFLENLGDGVKLISKEDFTFKGRTGREYVFEKKSFTYHYRCIILGGYIYQITYFTSEPDKSNHAQYFKSFQTK